MPRTHSEERKIKPNATLRGFGIFFVFIAVTALLWDSYGLLRGWGGARFSGVADIWQIADKQSFLSVQKALMASVSFSVWKMVLSPLMKAPLLLLCGLPGVWMMRAYAPAIQVRAPSLLELQMIQNGLNPRHHVKMRR